MVSSFDKMPKFIRGINQLKRFDKTIIDQHIDIYNFELFYLAKKYPHLIIVEDIPFSQGRAFDSSNLENSLVFLNEIKDTLNVQRFGSSGLVPYNQEDFINLHIN